MKKLTKSVFQTEPKDFSTHTNETRKVKMKNSILRAVVLAIIVALFAGACSAAFAAGGFSDWGNDLGGSFYSSKDSPSYSSWINTNGGGSTGSFDMRLDPNKVSFTSANWSFYSYDWDPSYWTATCYITGNRNSKEVLPVNQSWNQSTIGGDLKINASLWLNGSEWMDDGIERRNLSIGGNFNISPVEYTNSSFIYSEDYSNEYSWPNGYDSDPVILPVPIWRAEYRMSGRFLASTLVDAQAMGAPFVRSVPEPSAMVMLITAITLVASIAYRRK